MSEGWRTGRCTATVRAVAIIPHKSLADLGRRGTNDQITITVSADLKEKLFQVAAELHVDMNVIARKYLAAGIEQHEKDRGGR